MEPNFQDFLGFTMEKDIIKIIKDETLYFSNKVYKFNSFSIKQERNLVLTDKCLYNFQSKKLKRQMKYEEMLGITFSSQSNEFVVHANKGYDFHFLSQDKMIIIYIIAKCYEKLLNKPIILCEVKEKSLKQYVTTKKDKKKDSTNSRINELNKIDTQTFIIDNDPVEIHKRSYTEITGGKGGKTNNINIIQENPKNIFSEDIFSNDEKLKCIEFDDFEIIKIIGRGISGKVLLTKNRLNNQYYALKSIDNDIYDMNDSDIGKLKKFTKNLNLSFLINVIYCFETNDRVYFAFPYIQGEELLYHIKMNKNFDEKKIKFYAAIIALSLDYLHNNGIEYRFFSSKNILIDKDGYLKIIPFHIGKIFPLQNKSKKFKKFSNKFKNEYSPPEIFLEEKGITKAADWWNLGIIIFEMIYGITPFYSDNDKELKNIIINEDLKFPKNKNISDSLKDLIKGLLKKKYEERLGFKNGFQDIKNHEFFKDFNFEELKDRKIEPPYKPNIGKILENNKKYEKKYTYEDLKKSGILKNSN